MVWLYSKIYQISCEHQHRHDKALLVLVSALHCRTHSGKLRYHWH